MTRYDATRLSKTMYVRLKYFSKIYVCKPRNWFLSNVVCGFQTTTIQCSYRLEDHHFIIKIRSEFCTSYLQQIHITYSAKAGAILPSQVLWSVNWYQNQLVYDLLCTLILMLNLNEFGQLTTPAFSWHGFTFICCNLRINVLCKYLKISMYATKAHSFPCLAW